jgi:hypothetical protein
LKRKTDIRNLFIFVGIIFVIFISQLCAQDFEQSLSDFSEKFLAYSQNYVKLASQNIKNDDDYQTALKLSRIADEFHLHTGYLSDFMLTLRITQRHQKEKELIAQLVKARIEALISQINEAEQRIANALLPTEKAGIIASSNDFKRDLLELKNILERIKEKL